MNAQQRTASPGQVLELRSMPVLIMGGVLSSVLIAAALLGWVMLGDEIRRQFTLPQILTLLLFIAIMVGMMMSIGLSSILVDDHGIRVRNAVRTTRYGWDEVTDVQFNEGDPWAYLVTTHTDDLGEEKNHLMLAIQRSEGEAAQRRVEQLRGIIRERSTAPTAAAGAGTERG